MRSLYIFFLLLPSFAFSQEVKFPIDSITHRITYQAIVKVPDASKDDLYVRAREWFAKTFVSAQHVIQMDDKAAGKIIGKGIGKNFSVGLFWDTHRTVYYTLSITVKDGRYRYEITDIYYELETGTERYSTGKLSLDNAISNPKNLKKGGEYKGQLKDVSLLANTEALNLGRSIVATMAGGPTGTKSKDDF